MPYDGLYCINGYTDIKIYINNKPLSTTNIIPDYNDDGFAEYVKKNGGFNFDRYKMLQDGDNIVIKLYYLDHHDWDEFIYYVYPNGYIKLVDGVYGKY